MYACKKTSRCKKINIQHPNGKQVVKHRCAGKASEFTRAQEVQQLMFSVNLMKCRLSECPCTCRLWKACRRLRTRLLSRAAFSGECWPLSVLHGSADSQPEPELDLDPHTDCTCSRGHVYRASNQTKSNRLNLQLPTAVQYYMHKGNCWKVQCESQ